MKPYYQDNSCTIYCCSHEEITGGISPDLILTDPPYGISYRSNHNSCRKGEWAKWVRDENHKSIKNDDKPIDPNPLLALNSKMMVFGGNYIANLLPPTRCWVVWDKRDGISPNNQADCEMAWTNLDKPSRIYRHLWSGLLRAGEENISKSSKLHPHQKPAALMQFCVEYSDTTGLIYDPYMGSGSTLLAAKRLGRMCVGVDLEEEWCEVAARRLQQEYLPLG